MAKTTKSLSTQDSGQTLQGSYNEEDASLTVNGFLVGKVGRKVELAITTTTVADDTEVFTYKEDGVTLYEIEVVYTDGTRAQMLSAERIS
jgi:hypothetical protein